MTTLVVTTPDGQSLRHRLAGDSVRIGRSGRNDLVIDDATVSRIHAEVNWGPEGYRLIDLGARSGTFLNGSPVRNTVALRPGDRIRMGRTSIVVDGDTPPPVDLTPTPMPSGPGTTVLTPADLGAPTAAAADAQALMDIVLEADRQMLFHRPLDAIFDAILTLAARTIGFERAALMLLEDGRLQPVITRPAPAAADAPITISTAIVQRVLQQRESVLTSDAEHDTRFTGSKSVIDFHIRSAMCVPVRDEDKVLGLLYLDSRQTAGMYTDQHLRVLSHLASVAAMKIENARLFKEALRAREIELELLQAGAIQDHLLPSDSPVIPGYDVFGRSIPCRMVGGDSYDFITLAGERHVLTLGDVAGKGLPAALLMCCFHATVRALVASGLAEAEIMGRLNQMLCSRFPPNRFTTCFFSILDPVRHLLSYVNAGQETPYLLRRGTEPQPLAAVGLPLGLFEDSTYTAGHVAFEPGDTLLCYSDGITEGRSPAEEMFGHTRLLTAAAGASGRPAEVVATAITTALEAHHAGRSHDDDITLLVIRRVD